MIQTKKPDVPWWDKFRKPEDFPDSEDFVKGYNAALHDFDILFGTAKRDDGEFREATIHGGNQIHKVCDIWKLEYKK